jgi:hypothetical protein
VTFERLAKQTFQILRSYDYEVLLYNEEGNTETEPANARRFYARQENLLVSLTDDGDNSEVRLFLSPTTDVQSVMGMITSLRTMATKYNKLFRIKTSDNQINPKDFSTTSSVKETTERTMNILEGLYGTSRSSYLKLENARMIVRHSARINEETFGARGRNVDSIYIENHQGERVLFPTNHLAPARAMTHHVNNGGTWADAVGEQINRMAQDFAHLGATSRHIYTCGNELNESAHTLRATVREEMRAMRRTFESLCRKTRYPELAEALAEVATKPLNEGEDNDLSESIAALATLLNTPAVALSETVLASVARIMEGRPSAEDKMPMIGLLGDQLKAAGLRDLPIKVNAHAWEAFKTHDKLDLSSPVSLTTTGEAGWGNGKGREDGRDFGGIGASDLAHTWTKPSMPQFTDSMARHSYLLTQVSQHCDDASMGNLLAFIAEERPFLRNKPLAAIFDVIAKKAFRAANINPEDIKIRDRNPAMRELQDWFDGFNANETLVEFDRFELPDDTVWNHNDKAVDDVVAAFDVDQFLNSPATEHFDPADVSEDEIVSALVNYLEEKLQDDYEATGVDMQATAEHLLPTVSTALEEAGYAITPASDAGEHMMAAEDTDEVGDGPILSKEDVLLPKSMGDDLRGEVTPATKRNDRTGEDEPVDDSDISRLKTLAGLNSYIR